MSFSQAIAYRGAGLEIIWQELLAMTMLGLLFFMGSLMLFHRSMSVSK